MTNVQTVSGEVILNPNEESKTLHDHVWVKWCNSKIGDNGVCQEHLTDITLTGKVFVETPACGV